MTEQERNNRERSKMFLALAETEEDPILRDVLALRSERLAMNAVAAEFQRQRDILTLETGYYYP